ncbi:hypothetical protein [Streptomyces sp. RB17]|uniref:hypothetical protein n=1 Tax=Streptomyces sp. RB17 TaxID=2585197 RepID=UPI001294C363|nr:hypothetical protein [Streptomyces sp. RB17]
MPPRTNDAAGAEDTAQNGVPRVVRPRTSLHGDLGHQPEQAEREAGVRRQL